MGGPGCACTMAGGRAEVTQNEQCRIRSAELLHLVGIGPREARRSSTKERRAAGEMAAEPDDRRSRQNRDEERSGSAGEAASRGTTGGSREDPHAKVVERRQPQAWSCGES